MSGPLVGRVLRPVVLLVAGMFVAQTTVAVAAPRGTAATQTRMVSCAGYNFHPIDSATGYGYRDTLLIRTADTGPEASGFFVCDPHLPNKAVVTKVRFTIRDSEELSQIRFCGLDRSSLKAGQVSTVQTLGQVSATGFGSHPGVVRKTDSTISHATVDTADWAYWLQCRIELDGESATIDTGIYGADVTYTISSANG